MLSFSLPKPVSLLHTHPVSPSQPPPPCWQFLSLLPSISVLPLTAQSHATPTTPMFLLQSTTILSKHARPNKILGSHWLLLFIGVPEEVAALLDFSAFGKHCHSLAVSTVKTLKSPLTLHFYPPSCPLNHHSTRPPTKYQEKRNQNPWQKQNYHLYKDTSDRKTKLVII